MHNLSLAHFVNLYMFRAYLGLSSEGTTVCTQKLVRIVLLDDCVLFPNLMHNLFLVHFVNLYMFRAYLGLSSGGTTLCIQHLVIIVLLDVCLLSWLDSNPTRTTDSHVEEQYVPTVLYIRLYLLMIGLDRPETCRA